MLALYRCGRQAEALEAFHAARRLLVEEIGVEPGADLRGLQEAILRHDPSLELAPAELPRELDVSDAPAMVGREREMTFLRERWERARAGHGGLVAVGAGHGMGKTRLAGELAGQAHLDGAIVLYATGWQPTQTIAQSLHRAREATRPTLLVVDDADAGDSALAALGRAARDLTAAPALALATFHSPEAMARLGCDESLELDPLDPDAVRRIALAYAPGDVPADELAQASGGVPARVHELASAWARRRMAEVAGRAATGRRELRSVEDELAGGLAALQVARERVDPPVDDAAPTVCPFKGLASFDVEDAAVFFGRERLVADIVARLVGAPLLGVVGPSGSGKSSLVRAGLLPALAAGVLPGSDAWPQLVVRPGEHPLRELRTAQAELDAREHAVLVVDQFEEAFTACRDEDERHAFIDALARAGTGREGGVVVVLVIRADFYGRCAAYPTLARPLGANHVLVGPMRRDELRRAIELPAQRAGLRVDADLVDALIADVDGEPGALPLLSTTLLELWQHRDGRRLRLGAYEEAGGVHGAVARLAETAYARLDEGQQRIARAILLRLAGEGEGEALVRARVALEEFGDDARPVLAELTDGRLLTVGDGEVEVVHEALLREWPRLRRWLEEDAEGHRLHRHLIHAARDWQFAGRDPGELYAGARLASALDWIVGHEHELNDLERDFIADSRAEAESQAERQRRANQRLRVLLASLAGLLLLVVMAGGVALSQRGQARDAARVAEAQRLGIQALNETDLDRSLLLARQGVALDDSPATRSNLLTALLRAPAAIGVMRGTGNRLLALDLSPSGRTLAVGDSRGTVLFFDVATRRRVGPPYKPGGEVAALRFSPDGRRLAVIRVSSVDLVDTRTHTIVGHLFAKPPLPTNVDNVVFSSDSRVVAAGSPAYSGGESLTRHYIQRWNALTGRRLGHARSIPGAPVGFIAGTRLLVTSGPGPEVEVRDPVSNTRLATSSPARPETDVRDAATLRPIRHWRGGGTPATVSPDGRTLAYGGRDGSVHLLDLRTGKLRVAVGRHGAAVTSLRFLPDSRALVSAAADGSLIVWDVKRGARSEIVENPTGGMSELAIAPDGRTAYTAGQNGSVIAWDLSGARRLARPFRVPRSGLPTFLPFPSAAAPDVAASPDGETFAIPDRMGYANLFDSRTLARTGRIRLSQGPLAKVAIGPDRRTIAATSLDGHLAFADLRTRRPLGRPIPAVAGPPAFALAFSADGRWLATTSAETVAIWDAHRRTFVKDLTLGGYATDVSLSPDGATLAATVDKGGGSGELDIVSAPLLEPIARVRAPLAIWGRFSHDGRLLLYGDQTGRAWLFDTRTWRRRDKPLVGHTDAVLTVSLSPDGRTLATTSLDGTTRLWDVPSARAIGPALPGAPNHPVSGTFVDGGRGVVAAYDNGRGYLWDVRPESWARRACEVAGRTLTHDEWEDVLPERDYAPACSR
jgi:WD40 repeat protein